MNPLLAGIAPSLIRAINARKRPGDIDLGLGEPTLRPDPAPFEAALARVRDEGLPYTPNAGDSALREAIARCFAFPAMDAAANVCVTVGSEEALYLAIKSVLDPARDEVLIVEPCYLAYPKLCALEGVRHRTVALDAADGFCPRADAVLGALGPDTRMIILNTPCNPTGRVWPAAELRALADGLSARPGAPVYVLSDEVYRELYYTPERPASVADVYPHALVAGSLSKSNALTGLRLGWLMGSAEVIGAATKVHQLVNTAASTFSSHVALEIFRRPETLSAHRPLYAQQRELLMQSLTRHGVAHAPVEGAFYCFVRLPGRWASDSLGAAERLLDEHRVVTVPGIAFGAAGEGWLRLSGVAAPDALAAGIERVAQFFAA
ncbi:pyridoxal phosphate-dependent aminotransferase [Longimicrobium sp.]|uniref:pyridoxal phosphate-dependent aminotransferase n=1 Tax=Longimicrobium sp. TaxID=2029185 RepID=UPI002C094D32|nr:pyridoxal phosphate-dependent aminotransferase [Longimicrobium sp.]HSU16956.1 pyridoxal phosphate-dependent aminotransferase [Longimicrobium sp.]